MKNKKDFELDLLLAVDELLYEVNVRFDEVPLLLGMKERGYFQYVPYDMTLKDAIVMYKKLLYKEK